MTSHDLELAVQEYGDAISAEETADKAHTQAVKNLRDSEEKLRVAGHVKAAALRKVNALVERDARPETVVVRGDEGNGYA